MTKSTTKGDSKRAARDLNISQRRRQTERVIANIALTEAQARAIWPATDSNRSILGGIGGMNHSEPTGWQPIETAPRNESVLIFIPSAEHYGHGVYRGMLVDMGTGPHWDAKWFAHGARVRADLSAYALGCRYPIRRSPRHD